MENEVILSKILEIGEGMLISGGEVNRVEDSITRLCTAYHMRNINVFTITASIVVTVTDEKGQVISQTRRIQNYRTDFTKLERYNALSRELCAITQDADYMTRRLQEIREEKMYTNRQDILAYVLVSATFSVFFGGGAMDAVAAAMVGVLLYYMVGMTRKLEMNYIVSNLLCSFCGGSAAVLLFKLGIAQSVDKVIIGNIMLLIPGISLTNAIRDMISGDIMSGSSRLCEAILIAIAISLGFTITLLV